MSRGIVAFITGVSGQDGSYLAERLLSEGHEVHGLVRPGEAVADRRTDVPRDVVVHQGNLERPEDVAAILLDVAPDQVYNLAGVSSVARSWAEPGLTARVTGSSVADLLRAAADVQEAQGRAVHFVQASSAEIFGAALSAPQNESTPLLPLSPYGVAKASAHMMVRVFRENGLSASNCILYNHESPRRPTAFVTRKITSAVARIASEGHGQIALGNLEVRRDWGWAPDFVDALVRAASREKASDYVIATGVAHSVADFVEAAFSHVGMGESWREHVTIDPRFIRPQDSPLLVGDSRRAQDLLGWRPTVGFEEIVGRMVDADLEIWENGPA